MSQAAHSYLARKHLDSGTFLKSANYFDRRRPEMSVGTILLIILILILVGALPSWGHSRGWGYGPSGILGVLVVVLLVLLLMGRI
jgi:hypothetical protein